VGTGSDVSGREWGAEGEDSKGKSHLEGVVKFILTSRGTCSGK